MILKILQQLTRNGQPYNEGDKIELPDHIAKNWIAKGYGEKIKQKKSKVEIESKELKVEYIEIKSDEAN